MMTIKKQYFHDFGQHVDCPYKPNIYKLKWNKSVSILTNSYKINHKNIQRKC